MELKKHYTNEQTGISYTLHGDFYLPDIIPAEEGITIGRWGQMHRDFLRDNKKVVFNIMLTKGTLYHYLAEIDKQADGLFSRLVSDMAKAEGVTEQLKAQNQMLWIQKMMNIEARAREVVINELIYA